MGSDANSLKMQREDCPELYNGQPRTTHREEHMSPEIYKKKTLEYEVSTGHHIVFNMPIELNKGTGKGNTIGI